MLVALGVFLTLVAFNAQGVGAYLLGHRSALDGRSVWLWASDGLLPILVAVSLGTIALGLGRATAARLGILLEGRLGLIAATTLGLGLLAQAVFLVGILGRFDRTGLAVITLLCAAIAAPFVRGAGSVEKPSGNALQAVVAGFLAYAFACAMISALAPPIEWDVLAYHLALPEIYLKVGRIVTVPWMIHSHWPRLMETFYGLAMAFGFDTVPALIHLGAVILLVSGTAAVAGSGVAGCTAAILLVGQPALLRLAGCAHADGVTSLCVFAAAWSLSRWDESRRDGWLLAGGLLGGLAASTKLLGVAALGGWAIVLAAKTRRPREVAFFAGAGALMIGPWLAQTWWVTGDPVWPFLRNSREAAELATRYLRSNRWDFPPPLGFLTHDGPGYLLAAALGLFALSRGRRQKATAAERWLWWAAPGYVVLTWRHNEAWRFLMPIWPAIALAASRAMTGALSGGSLRKAAAACLILISLIPIAQSSPNNALFAVLGLRSSADPSVTSRALFLEKSVEIESFFKEARYALKPNSKVLLFREVRGYGAGFKYQWGDPMNQALIEYSRLANADALFERLRSQGMTHVLNHFGSRLYQVDPGYYDERIIALMDQCLKKHSRKVLEREGISLHELL